MGTPDKKLSELVGIIKAWIPQKTKTKPQNVSRDFWMPDQSCRVCYECDSQFTIFNRKHHCRLCGRVFCAKCTANSIPAQSDEPGTGLEDGERIRVCNYCFKQWEQAVSTVDNGAHAPTPGLSPSPSATSLASTKSRSTCQSSSSTVGSTSYSTGPFQCLPYNPVSSHQFSQMDLVEVDQEIRNSARNINLSAAVEGSSSKQFGYCFDRSDDEDDDYGDYNSDSETRHFSHVSNYYDAVDEIDHAYGPHEVHLDGDNIETKSLSCSPSPHNFDPTSEERLERCGKETDEHDQGDGGEPPPYGMESANAEPVDFENNGLLWLPPEPEDDEDEGEAILFDDDDDGKGATGEWGYLRSSNSFGSGEYHSRGKLGEEHKKALKNVVEGHFRALVAQILQVENLPIGDKYDKESWLDIITSLSWEAATLLKPDTSKGGGMDPGGYVKIKCIACGHPCESMVVKGVVCKKNVAHRRMTSKIDKPRFLILGGALEYQRVSNLLSSFDTLLQQEMDYLKMTVTKIDAHQPNVLLVEKSVSRYAQEYLLAKDISLVLNIKRPLLERIARCTGGQIVPSIDHLSTQKLGYCDMFHVEKLFEEHGSAEQCGKKLTKTLMFFEGCPKPLGCTILLKGASGDELKKVKHVVQYGVFAAYHLAVETSFLADEGASLPELPLKSPITVAVPDKPSSIDRSISTIPGFSVSSFGDIQGTAPIKEPPKSNVGFETDRTSSSTSGSISKTPVVDSTCKSEIPCTIETAASQQDISYTNCNVFLSSISSKENDKKVPNECSQFETDYNLEAMVTDKLSADSFGALKSLEQVVGTNDTNGTAVVANDGGNSELDSLKHNSNNYKNNKSNQNEEMGSSKEEFPPSPSDHQSILVFLSTRCVWKGTVCEQSHLVRIKYYGSFDKPLGRFLRDQLFDQSYHCHSCEMPSEAHVHCYTHRQGSLTISVKKLPEFLSPGEREGKIWMWHRCLKCPRINGFPPATRRVVMSDAAWGLSFGKFLELSFSNHAAASRVANCGHSLHRDCLRFYGFGRMVACFRYASIDLHSVYLPPPKLEFNCENQDWLQKEANEVRNMSEILFMEVYNALHEISEKNSGARLQDGGIKAPDFAHCIEELKGMIQREKEEFEESLQKSLSKEVKVRQPAVDILQLNKLRRQTLFHCYVWDQCLIHAANLRNNSLQVDLSSPLPILKDKPIISGEKLVEMNMTTNTGKGYSSCDSFLLETKTDDLSLSQATAGPVSQAGDVCKGGDNDVDLNQGNAELSLPPGANISNKSDPLECGITVRRVLSEGEYPIMPNLSDTLDAAWTGKSHPTSVTLKENGHMLSDSTVAVPSVAGLVTAKSDLGTCKVDQGGVEVAGTQGSTFPPKALDTRWTGVPFSNFYSSFNKVFSLNAQKIVDYNPVYISSFRELECNSGVRLLLPAGVSETIVPVYDDEPTSVIAHVLVSIDYHVQISEFERTKVSGDNSVSLPLFDSVSLLSLNYFDESISDTYRSLGSMDETAGPRSSLVVDPLLFTKDLHARVSFTDESSPGKVKYTVTCYFAKRFEVLRRSCCPSELDFVQSLSRCKKWGAQGGKSNVFFAKTMDDRFIIKQVTKTELESFIKFAPAYFKYLSESISSGSPTCLAKILGIYQVSSKHLKGGKETKMDVLVMENLLFRRNITRLYDLKGSSRSRYNPDTSGSNKVLLDQNLIEAMPTSPIFVGNKAKRLLERAVWNDTAFLASIYVMDYSLLVGVDEEKHELVLGIIDFMRQYTWDKHLETWVKTSGILGGPKHTTPTVISPQQYKKRFRKAMSAYFLMVPDQWSSP
ncbi:1-phosphatidylinositol-3-phosphate 5-kinase [Quillaja saponaria]|uniref:1-phosphatidylinositol-3-phosphate 5-kinase n=1 Tax=Quillaja saponaria TaxID=32244 RepID=A0AAD7QFG7_QUISA|nr:1-phosphatidylinositol-3-phosphate 5-kinase [Quillaja saponaria]